MDYIRLCEGVQDKGKFIPVSNDIFKGLDLNRDYYTSAFLYNDSHHEIFKTTGTVAGISDTVTNKLYWDFDSEDLGLAKKDATTLCNRLLTEHKFDASEVALFFSGKKGFHVEVKTTDRFTPNETKNICLNIGKDLPTLDRQIYNASRVFRLPLTKHNKSGLYKIPLDATSIGETDVEAIKDAAKSEYDVSILSGYDTAKISDSIRKMKMETPKILEKKLKDVAYNIDDVDWSNKPKFLTPEKYLLSLGFFDSGERSHALMILASTYKSLGLNETQTHHGLKATAELQAERTGDEKFPKKEIYSNVISQVFSPTWRGGVYSTSNNDLLQQLSLLIPDTLKKANKLITMAETGDDFDKYIKAFENNPLKFGLKDLDKAFPIPPSTNVAIIAAASAGKTLVALKLLKKASEEGMISVFASLDMARSRMFEKVLYSVTEGRPREEIFSKWKTVEGRKELKDLVDTQFKNVFMFNKSSPTIENIREYILEIEKATGKKVELLMIDYFERITSDFSDDTKASKMVAAGIQDIVNDMPDLRCITLVQPNKNALGGGPDSPIRSYTSIKGSSFLYQSFRQIISLWRPFFTSRTKDIDKYMQMAILKNDLGELGEFSFNFSGRKGDIWEMEDIERREFNELLKMKESKKEQDDDDMF